MNFIESFKLQSNNLDEQSIIAAFGVAIGNVALCWFSDVKAKGWTEIERNFKKTWCRTMLPMEAAEKVKGIKQPEEGYIRNYITSFEEYKRFFDGHISVSSIIELFLKNIRPSLKVHAIALKKKYADWNAFILAIQELDNEEQRDEDLFTKKKGIVSSVQDTEIEDSSLALGNAALSVEREVKELKSMFAEMLKRLDPGNTPLSSKMSSGAVQGLKRKSGCWNCGSNNHFNRDCPKPRKNKARKENQESSGKGKRN